MRTVGIGLAGLGTVGGGVYKHLQRNRALLQERTGCAIEVEGIDGVTADDGRFARQLGYAIKHLAVIKAEPTGAMEVRAAVDEIAKLACVRARPRLIRMESHAF